MEDDGWNTPLCFASFCIYGAELTPDEISRALELVPDHTHRKGDYPDHTRRGRPSPHSMWSTDSRLADEAPFEAHLEDLLSVLLPKQAEIHRLSDIYDVRFYCSLHSTIGFELPPHILEQIASLGANFGVSVYR